MNWASKIKRHGFFKKSRNRFMEKDCSLTQFKSFYVCYTLAYERVTREG